MTDDKSTQHNEELRRRMRAALALADLTIEELSERIGRRGYGDKTLYNMQGETGKRPILPQDIEVISKACGISPAFFSIDFSDLPDTTTVDRLTALEKQVSDLSRLAIEEEMTAALARAEERRINKPPKRNVPRKADP